jgi:hypothetical protein
MKHEKHNINNSKKYNCIQCDYHTNRLTEFTRHQKTNKHLKKNKHISETQKTHICINCELYFNSRTTLWRHKKHCKNKNKMFPNVSKCFQNNLNHFICKCGKKYKTRSGFYKHSQKCGFHENRGSKMIENDNKHTNNDVTTILKSILEENKELRKEIKNLKIANITNNNTQNNQFNINMFLNEKCKDAMNLEDFVEKIKFTLEDLNFTKENGYTKGISNIFIKNLNDLDVTERPIHCSDQKRLQFYVKNDNEWTKDENNEKIDNTIEKVSKKQIKSIQEWVEANPDFTESDAKMEEYFTLVRSITQPNDDKNLKNIKRKVGENVKLEKSENVK